MSEPSTIFYLAVITMSAAAGFAVWQLRRVAKARSRNAPPSRAGEDTQ